MFSAPEAHMLAKNRLEATFEVAESTQITDEMFKKDSSKYAQIFNRIICLLL